MNARVLVVEDEWYAAQDIRQGLEVSGFSVPSIASSGEEAIVRANSESPDLVLMDINLRGEIDGIDAAKIIAERFELPVVFLTAYSDDALLKRARTVGSFGYLIKPFQERELCATLELALYKHDAEKRLKKLVRELRNKNSELHKANEEIKTLRGILPICATCKQIRDDQGYWHDVAVYISEHTEAEFSHGICESCLRKHYPDVAKRILEKG